MFNLFKKKKPGPLTAKTHPKAGKLIEFAFECEGVKYFKFKNEMDFPSCRAGFVQQFYNELAMNTDRQMYITTLDAITENVNRGQLGRVAQLVQILKDRSEYLFAPDVLYRLASAVYFTEDEDLTQYDDDIAIMKIEAWKRDGVDFFFNPSLRDLVPHLNLSKKDLATYLKAFEVMTKSHQNTILEFMDSSSTKGGNTNTLKPVGPIRKE